MLTGKPPFQSNTQEEIYRKARERDYDWPTLETSDNQVCNEAKNLVFELLQDAQQRPGPDDIVVHEFFTSGWTPAAQDMTAQLRVSAPAPFPSFGSDSVQKSAAANLKKLYKMTEVGPYAPQKPLPSTYREVAAEEKAGLTPAVPLPGNVVYRPFDEILKEQGLPSVRTGSSSRGDVTRQEVPQPVQAANTKARLISSTPRAPAQSFAAQQRAQAQPTNKYASLRSSRLRPAAETRANNVVEQPIVVEPVDKKALTMSLPIRRPKALIPRVDKIEDKVEVKVEEIQPDVQEQLPPGRGRKVIPASVDRNPRIERKPAPEKVPEKNASLFSPLERREPLPGTKPDQILRGIQRFHDQLEEALAARGPATVVTPPTAPPTIVVKWVDYTNKFGLGYILSNGSVGCIFKASAAESSPSSAMLPPSCVVVRDSETHLQNRANESYPERHQLVPTFGPGVEFYENKPEQGISRVVVPAREYEIRVDSNGEAAKLSRGKDEYDDRKRSRLVLWKKFANYMTAYGRDQEFAIDEASNTRSSRSKPSSASDIVIFYQRFGDVGCWVFCDGHFQVSQHCTFQIHKLTI
jgi:hypothetical protein